MYPQVISSSIGPAKSVEIERSRTGDHSLFWVLVSIGQNAPWVNHVWIVVNGEPEGGNSNTAPKDDDDPSWAR